MMMLAQGWAVAESGGRQVPAADAASVFQNVVLRPSTTVSRCSMPERFLPPMT